MNLTLKGRCNHRGIVIGAVLTSRPPGPFDKFLDIGHRGCRERILNFFIFPFSFFFVFLFSISRWLLGIPTPRTGSVLRCGLVLAGSGSFSPSVLSRSAGPGFSLSPRASCVSKGVCRRTALQASLHSEACEMLRLMPRYPLLAQGVRLRYRYLSCEACR